VSCTNKGKNAPRKSQARIQFDPREIEAPVPGPLTVAEANELIRGFKKAVFARALGAELTHHFGYGQDEPKPTGQTNHRNGSSAKTVATTPVRCGWRSLETARAAMGQFSGQFRSVTRPRASSGVGGLMHQMGGEHRVDLVLQPHALTEDLGATGHLTRSTCVVSSGIQTSGRKPLA
jgi:Transposase, Mutator family